jgi:hypothetical protein
VRDADTSTACVVRDVKCSSVHTRVTLRFATIQLQRNSPPASCLSPRSRTHQSLTICEPFAAQRGHNRELYTACRCTEARYRCHTGAELDIKEVLLTYGMAPQFVWNALEVITDVIEETTETFGYKVCAYYELALSSQFCILHTLLVKSTQLCLVVYRCGRILRAGWAARTLVAQVNQVFDIADLVYDFGALVAVSLILLLLLLPWCVPSPVNNSVPAPTVRTHTEEAKWRPKASPCVTALPGGVACVRYRYSEIRRRWRAARKRLQRRQLLSPLNERSLLGAFTGLELPPIFLRRPGAYTKLECSWERR